MFPEHILRHDLFPKLFEILFNQYYYDNEDENFAIQFIYTSYHHSITKRQQQQQKKTAEDDQKRYSTNNQKSFDQNNNMEDDMDNDEMNEKLISLFVRNDNGHNKEISAMEMKAVTDFISDFCAKFLEYGAQYDSFIQSMRMFLHPSFPNEIRVNLLTKLSGFEHLLTTTKELDNPMLMKASLDVLFPERRMNIRDTPEFLDLVTMRMKKQQSREKGFFYRFCIGTLSRSLTVLMDDRTSIVERGMQKRLKGISWESIQHIIVTSLTIVNKGEHEWIVDLFELCDKECTPNLKHLGFVDESWSDCNHAPMISETEWNVFMERLRSSKSANTNEKSS